MTEHCDTCPWLFKNTYSCPIYINYQQNSIETNIIQAIMVFCSCWYGYPHAWFFGLKGLLNKKSCRSFLMTILGLAQLVVFSQLKNIIKQERPINACAKLSSYGMPSGHSVYIYCQFTWYILEWYYFPKNSSFKQSWVYQLDRLGVFMFGWLLVPYSRVYLNYHTIEQVMIGSLIGVLLSIILFISLTESLQNEKSLFSKLIKLLGYKNDFVIEEYKIQNNLKKIIQQKKQQ